MQILRDLRYATRQFLQAPGFTLTAILTLGLGIGATTAIFTLVHAVLLKSLPVAEPHELYRVGDNENCCVNGGFQGSWSLFSYAKYEHFRDDVEGFTELAAFQAGRSRAGVRRSGSDQPAESQQIQYVSGNYFSMFGVGSYIGRVFTRDDDRDGADPVVVMSYRTWSQDYGMDPSVVGASFTFNGRPFTVIGRASREIGSTERRRFGFRSMDSVSSTAVPRSWTSLPRIGSTSSDASLPVPIPSASKRSCKCSFGSFS